jgi:hypothetical protein
MISGRQALASIENAISSARAREGELESALASATEEAARHEGERARLLKELARVRLDALNRGEVQQALDSAERRALELIRASGEATRMQAARRKTAFDSVRKAEEQRHQRAERLEAALAAFEKVRAAAEPGIRAGALWREQQEKISAARSIAAESEKKATLAEEDCEVKRKPYEADPLFMYLWRIGFATADYRAGTFARFFDRRVAGLVGYIDAAANYRMLQEIPLRLREHAERRKAAIAEEEARLAEVETRALAESGAGGLIAAIEQARVALREAETELSTRNEALAVIEKETAANAGDKGYDEAIALLAQAMGRDSLRDLASDAASTRTQEDDRLVLLIDEVGQRAGRSEQEVRSIRDEMREMARRRSEIERQRDDFRRQGYDNPHGSFLNENILGQVLGGILQGALQGAILRDTLRDGYRQRDPGWGGSSGPVFPFPPAGGQSGGPWVPDWLDGGSGPWGGGGGGGGGSWGGGGGGRSSGGGGGDGFKTGGGF